MFLTKVAIAVLGIALISGQAEGSRNGHSTHVNIDSGPIIGTTTSLPSATAAVNQFLGIPFAAPPERFAPPERPQRWRKPLKVQSWKPSCIQQFNYPEASRNFIMKVFSNPMPEESEDCLYLNVYAPAAPAAGKGRAVMVWIYGGALMFGHAGQPSYDGSSFAAYQDVIIVTFNYRTNVFGFPNTDDLPLTKRNLGLLDQRLALDWVQRNIKQFGGDPDKVTIFGESAGAFSVDALITSYKKDPPFRAGILESGQTSITGRATTNTSSWDKLVDSLKCPSNERGLACARKAPALKIKSLIEHAGLSFRPVADEVTLVSNPAKARTEGDIAKVPVLCGTNSQEQRVSVSRDVTIDGALEELYPGDAAKQKKIKDAYSLGKDGLNTPFDVVSQIYTERGQQCPQALFANASAAANIPTWRYYFNASFPNTQAVPGLGVYHSSEISIVYGTYPQENSTAQEVALSQYMQGAWAQFAKNPAGGPGWNALGTFDGVDLGAMGSGRSSGVTVIRQSEVDYRCGLFDYKN